MLVSSFAEGVIHALLCATLKFFGRPIVIRVIASSRRATHRLSLVDLSRLNGCPIEVLRRRVSTAVRVPIAVTATVSAISASVSTISTLASVAAAVTAISTTIAAALHRLKEASAGAEIADVCVIVFEHLDVEASGIVGRSEVGHTASRGHLIGAGFPHGDIHAHRLGLARRRSVEGNRSVRSALVLIEGTQG